MPVTDLRAYLFDAKPHLLSPSVGAWLTESKRFQVFAEANRDKIRKKLRDTRDREAMRDLGCELEAAYWLTQDRRLTVEYEKCEGRTTCPDFKVTYTTSYTFGVEVTRVRTGTGQPPPDGGETRLIERVADKLRQMQVGMMNVLWVVMDEAGAGVDLTLAMAGLRQRAERGDPLVIGRHDLADTSDFFKYYFRLSGVVLRAARDGEPSRLLALWANPQAKHPLPPPLKTLLQSLT